MNFKLDYITDDKGRNKSVVIPHKQWMSFQSDYYKIKNKLRIILGLKDAIEEVKAIRSGKKKGETLKDFLDEL